MTPQKHTAQKQLPSIQDDITICMQAALVTYFDQDEEVICIARGVGNEALVVTNKRVYTINTNPTNDKSYVESFEFHEINGVKLFREYRVGKCQILTPHPEKYESKSIREQYGLDHSTDVVNFPYVQFATFNIARRHILVLTGKINPEYAFD